MLDESEKDRRISGGGVSGLCLSVRRACQFQQWSSPAKSFGAAFLYFAVSIALTLLNKSVFAVYEFRATRVLALAQMAFSLLFLHLFNRFGLITLPRISWPVVKLCAPLSLSYVAMMICGFDAMRGTNLVMFDTLRRTTIVFVIVVEWWCMPTHPWPSQRVLASSMMCLLGTLIAGATDLTFDMYGYVMAALTNLSTSLYIVLIRWVKQRAPPSAELDSFAMLYYNVLISFGPLTVYSWWSGDFALFVEYPYRWNAGFQLVFGLSAVLGFVINYSVFLNTLVNSALTQVITGQAKSVGVLSLGAILFRDVVFSVTNTIGVLISVGAGAWYALIKHEEGEAEKAEKARKAAESRALEHVAVVSDLEAARRAAAGDTANVTAPLLVAAPIATASQSSTATALGHSSAPRVAHFDEPATPAPAALPPIPLPASWQAPRS